MILVCPSCAARFMIPDGALGTTGRTVRCGACAHSWHQFPEPVAAPAEPVSARSMPVEPAAALAADPPSIARPPARPLFAPSKPAPAPTPPVAPVAPAPAPAPAALIAEPPPPVVAAEPEAAEQPEAKKAKRSWFKRSAPEAKADAPPLPAETIAAASEIAARESAVREEPRREIAVPAPPIVPPDVAARELAAADAEGARGRRGASRVLVWFLFVFVVAAIVLGGYRYRQDVVRLWPPATRLYQVLGIAVDPPSGYWLRVPEDSIKFRREADSGTPILVVSGEILNQSEKPQRVAPMRILLLDKEGRILRTEHVKLDDRMLDPGKRMPFQTSIPNSPPEAVAVRITFDVSG